MAYPLSGTRRRSLSPAGVGARGGPARDARGAGAPSAGDPVRARWSRAGDPRSGEGARLWARVGVRSSVCARAPGRTVQLFPRGSLCFLAPSSLSLSHWLINNEKKEGRKRFPKKVDCREAVCFRPLPPDGLCSAPFSVSLHLQSKLGGKKRGESCLLLPRSCPSFSCQLSSHLSGGCGN